MPGGIPAHLRFSKVFYKPDLEAVKADEDNARALGPGAVDEWHKGLQTRGREAMADSARWEKWELQMRPGTDLAQVLREYDLSSFPRHIAEAQGRSAGVDGVQPSFTVNGKQCSLLPFPFVSSISRLCIVSCFERSCSTRSDLVKRSFHG